MSLPRITRPLSLAPHCPLSHAFPLALPPVDRSLGVTSTPTILYSGVCTEGRLAQPSSLRTRPLSRSLQSNSSSTPPQYMLQERQAV